MAAKAGEGAVRITRRDAEDLIIMRAGDLLRHDAGIALASRLMRASLRRGGNIAEAVADTFGWMDLLSLDGRKTFTAEIERLIWSAAELGEYTRLLQAMLATARNRLVDAWDFLTGHPHERCDHCYPLSGNLEFVTINGVTLTRWQYKVTEGGRIWHVVANSATHAGTVLVEAVHTGHPTATDTNKVHRK